MKINKNYIIFVVMIAILIMTIISTVITLKGKSSRQVSVAMRFIYNLNECGAIDVDKIPKAKDYKEIRSNNNENSLVKYTLITDDFGIDLDQNFKVIGFLNKFNPFIDGKEISKSEAIKKAKSYLDKIVDSDVKLYTIKDDSNKKSNDYIMVFNRYYKGYKCYSNQITIGINKYTGKLSSFIGVNDYDHKYISKIRLDKKDVNKIVKNYLKEYSLKEIKENDIELQYFKIKPQVNKLVYVVKVGIVDKENNYKEHEVIVDAEEGNIIYNTLELKNMKLGL